MKRQKLILFSAVCAILISVGSLKPGGRLMAEDSVRASFIQALAKIESAYEVRSLPDFSDCLDGRFEGLLEFQARLQDVFLSAKSIEVMFVIDTYLVERNKVNVGLHWHKKAIDQAGEFFKTEGEAQLVFTQTAQGLKLLYIRGDNPFI